MSGPIHRGKSTVEGEKEEVKEEEGRERASANVSAGVVIKLLAFTLAMVLMPISSYFVSLKYVFVGRTTYAAGCAAIVANGVLLAYIVAALLEDRADQQAQKKTQ